MAEGQNDKYLNLPELTPEEEEEIERREAKLAAAREKLKPVLQQKMISDTAAAVLGGASDTNKTADSNAAEAKRADAVIKPAAEAAAPAPADTDEPLFTEVLSENELREHLSKLDRETIDSVLSASEIFKSCVLPDKTELQERLLKTKSDIIIGDHSRIEFGLTGEDIAVCECTTISGDIVAGGDLRLDNFCEVFGTVICNGDAYIGEGVKIHGKMTVGGNLDVAESVTIEKEFKTFGNITIRNPTPVILYLLIYILALLQINGEKAAEKKLKSMLSEAQTIPLVLPPRTNMDLAYFSVITPMEIGANCRLHGNIRAASVKMKHDTTLFGSIHASNKIKVGVRDAVHGDVAAPAIRIERGADVLGDVLGETVWMHEDARVSGVIKASAGLTFGAGN
ncbi:MAG TPA: hypothetical protein O0X97_02735 [Methanocorpusculum sp.]|nr:hypothetical protein [Methanocorpusculum sp.]